MSSSSQGSPHGKGFEHRMFSRLWALAALTLATSSSTFATIEELPPQPDLESAVHEVLIHNDLADIDFLSRTLGIGFRVSPPVRAPYWFGSDDNLNVRVMVTSNPASMLAQGLAYHTEQGAKVMFELRFDPRERPNLRKWATDWKQELVSSTATDFAGTGESIRWGGPTGIKIDVFYTMRGEVYGKLTQYKDKGAPFSNTVSTNLLPPALLTGRTAALITSGDLRNYEAVAQILGTKFTIDSGSMREGRWFYGSALYEVVMDGIDPANVYYKIDESGWVSKRTFIVLPAHLGNRTVGLMLPVDVYHICVAPTDIESELKRKAIRFTLESRDPDSIEYSIIGKNKITLGVTSFRGCVNNLDFRQITDFDPSLAAPLVFSVNDSVDRKTGKLNDAALRRVNWVVARAAEVRLGGIDIDLNPGDAPTGTDRAGALATLVRNAFSDRGIPTNLLMVKADQEPDKSPTEPPCITVDAYTE